MKKIIIALALLFSYAFAFTGYVVDENNKPIAKVLVKNSKNKVVFTDVDGKYEIAFFDSLSFFKTGYLPLMQKKPTKTVILSPKTYHLKGIKVSEQKFKPEIKTINKTIVKPAQYAISTNAADILKNHLKVANSQIPGKEKKISLAGHSTKHTSVMLDGIVLNPNGESFDISQIPADIIAEIEIIEGSSSAISGSGSIGGIVNIITKQSSERLSSNVAYSYGSYSYNNVSTSLSTASNLVKVKANASYQSALNNFKFKNPLAKNQVQKRKNNKEEYKNLNLFTYINFDDLNINHSFLYADKYKQLPGPINTLRKFDKCFTKGFSAKNILTFDYSSFVNAKSKLYYFDEKSKYDNTKSSIGVYRVSNKTQNTKTGFELELSKKIKFLKVKSSVIYEKESFDNTVIVGNPASTIKNLWMQKPALAVATDYETKIKNSKLAFVANYRYDFPARSDRQKISPFNSVKLEANWIYDFLSIGYIYGNSFNLPSFYDLWWIGDSHASGNPDLKPETSSSHTVFTKFTYDESYIKLSYYKANTDDLIFWYKSLSKWKPGNIANAENTVYSIKSLLKPFDFFEIDFAYERRFAIDKTKNDDGTNSNYYNKFLTNTPRSLLNATATAKFKHIHLSASYNRNGTSWPTQDHKWGSIPPYELVNASVSYNNVHFYGFESSIKLAFNNIFDKEYKIFDKEPKPGFNWLTMVNIGYKL